MEPFVRLVVAGGLVVLAGLWTTVLAATGSPPWFVGVALAVAGAAALAAGIRQEIRT